MFSIVVKRRLLKRWYSRPMKVVMRHYTGWTLCRAPGFGAEDYNLTNMIQHSVHIYIYIYIYIYTYIHTYIHTYTYMYTHICVYVYIYIYYSIVYYSIVYYCII